MYFVYILECKDGSLYTGITTNVERRFKQHKQGKGSAFTRSKKVVRILYVEEQNDRSSALKREAEIKHYTRPEKLQLINTKPSQTPKNNFQ